MGTKQRGRHVSSSPSSVERNYIDLSDDDDDEHGTADLTLGILAKAEKRERERLEEKTRPEVIDLESEDDECIQGEDAEEMRDAATYRELEPEAELEEGELKDVSEPQGDAELEAPVSKSQAKKKKKKKEKKEKREKRKREAMANMDTSKPARDEPEESKLQDAEESLAMRKLLRGPRYFDPPEEQGETCYNCGKQGHKAADCLEQPREKPCYVCGNFGHAGYDCPEKTECYECGKSGHVARHCPNKHHKYRSGTGVCLLCGRSGHDASVCSGEYDPQDFEQVRCYICKRTGHLCCVEVSDASPTPVSCYQCGDLGHTGVSCNRQNSDRGDKSSCYKCGQEGHFARECHQMYQDYNIKQRRHSWPAPWSADDGRYGEQESPVTPHNHGRPPSFKSRLEQASSGKSRHHDESRRGSKRKWKEAEDDRWTPRLSDRLTDSHRYRLRD